MRLGGDAPYFVFSPQKCVTGPAQVGRITRKNGKNALLSETYFSLDRQ